MIGGTQRDMIKVLVVDDHPIVLNGIRQVLADTPDVQVAGQATSGAEELEMLRHSKFDVVTLDLAMPGLSGLDLLKQIRDEKPNLPILVLSVYPEDQYAIRCLKAGASGYLNKASVPEDLVRAVRTVADRRRFITPELGERLADHVSEPDRQLPPHERLSDREYEVMRRLGSGKSVSEIGNELFLSVKTVSTYRARILAKMGLENNAQIMRYCFEHGLVK